MAIELVNLNSTKSSRPPLMTLYGVDGVGKTSLAAEFPDPVYLHTAGEEPPSDIDLPSFGSPEALKDVFDVIEHLLTTEHGFKTLIIDSLDGLESMVWAATCERIGSDAIDDNGKDSPASYGRGYVQADTEWNELINALLALTAAGVAVVLIAHPSIVQFNSPTSDPYSRYELKLHKRAAALIREKSQIVGFMNYRISLKEKVVAPKKSVSHAEGGGERVIYLEERPGFNAKNRYSMPDKLTFRKGAGYAELAKYFPAPTGVAA